MLRNLEGMIGDEGEPEVRPRRPTWDTQVLDLMRLDSPAKIHALQRRRYVRRIGFFMFVLCVNAPCTEAARTLHRRQRGCWNK